MKKLTIELHIDNSAFKLENGETDFHSIQDQIVLVAEEIGDGNIDYQIRDFNGNNVGQYFIDSES